MREALADSGQEMPSTVRLSIRLLPEAPSEPLPVSRMRNLRLTVFSTAVIAMRSTDLSTHNDRRRAAK